MRISRDYRTSTDTQLLNYGVLKAENDFRMTETDSIQQKNMKRHCTIPERVITLVDASAKVSFTFEQSERLQPKLGPGANSSWTVQKRPVEEESYDEVLPGGQLQNPSDAYPPEPEQASEKFMSEFFILGFGNSRSHSCLYRMI
jgi:hypothetical protein